MRTGSVLLVLILVAAGWQSSAEAQNAELSPHRAVYELALDGPDSSGSLVAFTGRLVIDVSGSSCEGYSINTRYVYRRRTAEGDEVLTDLRTSQFEASERGEFRFSHRRFEDDKLVEQSEGMVNRNTEEVSINIEKPAERDVTLEKSVMFPNEHVVALLNAAMAGERHLSATIYDGSKEADEFVDTFAILGRSRDALEDGETAQQLTSLSHWPVSIGYFDGGLIDAEPAADEETPLYTMSFKLFENGISDRIRIDYGTFVLAGKLAELELRDAPPCN
ncbi:MAG: DUF1849 family protein [Pseudomonadota bacterium]